MTLHFIHVGKTGGTAIKRALASRRLAHWEEKPPERVPETPFGRIVLHHHAYHVADVPRDDYLFFCVRDPIERFLSGFYSRLDKGQPRYYFEWTPAERAAFEAFPTPERLACALYADDEGQRRRARRAMRKIRHLRPMVEPIGTPMQLWRRRGQIAYIARQETLNADWDHLKRLFELPPKARLPRNPIKAHRRAPSPDGSLGDEARQALAAWYAHDYRLLRYCELMRAWHGWGVEPGEAERHPLRREARRLLGMRALAPPLPERFRSTPSLP